jgi:hypothetical protein
MKFNPNDALLEALVADEEALSARAASAIRSRRRRNRRLGAAAAAAFAAVVAMLILPGHNTPRREQPAIEISSLEKEKVMSPEGGPVGKGFVKAYPEDSTLEEVLSQRAAVEKQSVPELNNEPVLIVRNGAGQIKQVHVFAAGP